MKRYQRRPDYPQIRRAMRPRRAEALKQLLSSTEAQARFWSKVEKSDGCWLWTAARITRGYGMFSFKDTPLTAHQVAYVLSFGPIPEGKHICHHCDTPPCCRPDHLYAGTPAQNMADRDKRGRAVHPRGERHGQSKLTLQQVQIIRTDPAMGSELAARFGVSRATVSNIRNNHIWSTE